MGSIKHWLNQLDLISRYDESKIPELRLKCLWNALAGIDELEWAEARSFILFSYGLIDAKNQENSSDEMKQNELEFARMCLEGKGEEVGKYIFRKPNLISVLAMEYGLLKMYGENSVSRPWFGGDWISMAELIIHICRGRKDKSTFSKGPRDLIRLYPVKWDKDSSENVYGANFSLSHIGGQQSGENQSSTENEKIYLKTTKEPPLKSLWISLAAPIGRLNIITDQQRDGKKGGIPENLWEALPPRGWPGAQVG